MTDTPQGYHLHEVEVRIRGNLSSERSMHKLEAALGSVASRLGLTYAIGEHITELPEHLVTLDEFHATALQLGMQTSSGSRAFNALRRTSGALPAFRDTVGVIARDDGKVIDYISSRSLRYFSTHPRDHVYQLGEMGRSILDALVAKLDETDKAASQDTPNE